VNCDDVRPRLTAYLDGELEGDRGSAVRGHLRECPACRQVATDEAALRDGLRALPPMDPPPSLWAGVQARLAAAEVADAHKPAWRRALARWAPAAPRFALGAALAAAAAAIIVWRVHRPSTEEMQQVAQPRPAPAAIAPAHPSMPHADDVTADLAGDAARATQGYADTAQELLALAADARRAWAAERQQAFDARVAALRTAVDTAAPGRAQQRAWRALIHYVQGAVVRDDVALAGVAP
jgi:hypothetical protein